MTEFPPNDSISPPPPPPNPFSQGLEELLNYVFKIDLRSAERRMGVFFLLFLGIWFSLGMVRNFPNSLETFLSLFNFSNLAELFLNLKSFILLFFTSQVLRNLLVLFTTFWVSYLVVGIYPADIFEKPTKLGRQFLMQAAFGVSYKTITISEGRVSPDNEDSPMLLIGGPGYIRVNLDSAVLVEGPDGPRIIGPTGRERKNRAVLSGHERIRQCADLRDIPDTQTEYLRSRDGIPIIARDIRYVYSIHRGDQQPGHMRPYPFAEKALRNQVYKQGRTIGKPNTGPDWQKKLPNRIPVPIVRQISSFIAGSTLSEILANIGDPEIDQRFKREEDIYERMERIVGNNEGIRNPTFDPGQFKPRDTISRLYTAPAFKKVEEDRGFQLRWIGVGTWDLPHEIISQNHMQAWKISRDNAARSEEVELQKIEENSNTNELLKFVQELLAIYRRSVATHEPIEQTYSILGAQYFERFMSAFEIHKRDNKIPHPGLLDAILYLKTYQGLTSLSHKQVSDYFNQLHKRIEQSIEKLEPAPPDVLEACWAMSKIIDENERLSQELNGYFRKLVSQLSDYSLSNQVASVEMLNTIWTLKVILSAPDQLEAFLRNYLTKLRAELKTFSDNGEMPPQGLMEAILALAKMLNIEDFHEGNQP